MKRLKIVFMALLVISLLSWSMAMVSQPKAPGSPPKQGCAECVGFN